jgi:Glucose-6-phosphate dehydrogenase, C-terminal domain
VAGSTTLRRSSISVASRLDKCRRPGFFQDGDGVRGAFRDRGGLPGVLDRGALGRQASMRALRRFFAPAGSDVLRSIRPLSPEDAVHRTCRARYTSGQIGGHAVPGYTEEDGVDAGHRTETFVWFDDPGSPKMTALYLGRYLNYGLTRAELQSGRPIDRPASGAGR